MTAGTSVAKDVPAAKRHRRRMILLPDGEKATIPELVLRYLLLAGVIVISIGPFLWQLSTSLKGVGENLYTSPPQFLPSELTLENYAAVTDVIPVWSYVGNSLFVAFFNVTLTVIGCAMAGYALARLQIGSASCRERGQSLRVDVVV